jgi:hypothetical protein
MTEAKIDISELKAEGGDVIKDLAEYLKQKTQMEVETATDELTVKSEEEPISRAYLRVLLKKFLHKQELKEYFRVISCKDNVLKVKEIKITEEE